ncbi:ATP-binding protein [Labrys okinawensis]|uniref:ATP-binding protein n=1 Tax=Labrys okinawensis TaxID=346911 RepID=UPI0039BC385B
MQEHIQGAKAMAVDQIEGCLSFGPFKLSACERLLTKDSTSIELGARALDLLIVLISSPNQVIGKNELMSRVWLDLNVEVGSLRFHMSALRKALGDGQEGARYIVTVPGRGYCFVAPVSREGNQAHEPAAIAADFPFAKLPSHPRSMIGRASDVEKISERLTASRFVTIVGAGGVGKTTVAVAVGQELSEAFAGRVVFVDLGTLSDPRLVAMALASILGLTVHSEDPTPNLIAHLREKRILLIFDTCEHLIEAVAILAFRIFMASPGVHILATSREALQVEAEHIYRLDSLSCPPDDPTMTAAVALTFPAIQLFLERAVAGGAHVNVSDAEAVVLGDICRKLDGVALAIELAARRVEAYGLQQTAELLDKRLALLWVGPRTAPPRHRTLRATLDWSYSLLSDLEQFVLRRLAVFVGHFTMDAALAVTASPTVDQALVFAAIDSLVAKSMIATRPVGAMMRYRLLDTTRTYVLEICLDDIEAAKAAANHANFFQQWAQQAVVEWPFLSSPAERALRFTDLNNVRAALAWCFGTDGDTELGVRLAAAGVPIFLVMSLLPECHQWADRAIAAIAADSRGGVDEMRLQAALGMSLMLTRGNSETARLALHRSLTIAEHHGDALAQIKVLGPLYSFHLRIGDFKMALHYAERSYALSEDIDDPSSTALGHSLLGISFHLMGNLARARQEMEAIRQPRPHLQRTSAIYFGYDHYNWARGALARTLWLQGHPAEALELAHATIEDATRLGHPVTLSFVLNWAVSVFLWAGDLGNAQTHIDHLIAHAESHSLTPYLALGRGFRGELDIRQGDARGGVESLRTCLNSLHKSRYEVLTTGLNISLAQGLSALGEFAEGMAVIDGTIRLVEANGDVSYLAELLRVKAGLSIAMQSSAFADAETMLLRSLALSRHQGARAWELRAATDLAALWANQARFDEAHALLRPIYRQFGEASDTADLRAAAALIAGLNQSKMRSGRSESPS